MRAVHWFLMLIAIPLLLIFQNCGRLELQKGGPQFDLPLPKLEENPGNFADCREIVEWQRHTQNLYHQYLLNNPQVNLPLASSTGGANPSSASITNRQEAGVDEPDILKADSSYFYYARAHSIEMVDKATLRQIGRLLMSDLTELRLFLDSGRLIVLGEDSTRTTVVRTFTAGPVPSLVDEKRFPGQYQASRLTGGEITLVMNQYIDGDLAIAANRISGIECNKIQRPAILDFNFTMTAVHKVNTSTLKVNSLATLGLVDRIYMTVDHLYLMSNGYTWLFQDSRLQNDELAQSSIVRKFDIRSGKIDYLGIGRVAGYAKDQFSFQEIGQRLFVATTFGSYNRISVLRHEPGTARLKLDSVSPDFGYREDIRSVRYVGQTAYVVTFQKTDPLFAFDLSDGTPRLMSHLEIPGFSSYLHPVAPGRLLGVGYAAVADNGFAWAGGVQISVFDVSRPFDLKALQQTEYGGRMSHADVTGDHHAFFYADGLAVIPMTLIKKDTALSPFVSSGIVEFSGAMVLAVGDQATPVARISHAEWIPAACKEVQKSGTWWATNSSSFDVRRVTKLGEKIISFSPFGFKVNDSARNFSTTYSKSFQAEDEECSALTVTPFRI